MNHNEKLEFNGKKITIGDLYKKSNKEIVIGLFIQGQDLYIKCEILYEKIKDIDEKIDKQWAKISQIKYIKGILFILVPIVMGIMGYVAYTR